MRPQCRLLTQLTHCQQFKYLLSTFRAAHKSKHKYFRSYDPKALAHYEEFYPEVTAQCEVIVRHRTAMDRTSVQFNEELLNSPGQTQLSLALHVLLADRLVQFDFENQPLTSKLGTFWPEILHPI
jgi:hypothetical protein